MTALDDFTKSIREAAMDDLSVISAYMDNHMGKNTDLLNYGDAGDAARVASMLQEIKDLLP